MAYEQLRERCFFKTGRDGVVLEILDELYPNLFDVNAHITNSIFKKYSQIKVTLVDARKTNGKGSAIYYNLSPEEILLLTYILSDGNAEQFKKRAGAFSKLSALEQVSTRNIIATFDTMNFGRFDALIRKSEAESSTMISLQKNINVGGDKLLVRRFSLSYEEAMRNASKWKITLEMGNAIKDEKGNGLNVVKAGSFVSTAKTQLNLQVEEIVYPINEGSRRVMMAQSTFYPLMKSAEVDFTKRKLEAKDYNGERIDEWNPQGKNTFEAKEKETENDGAESKPETAPKVQTQTQPQPSNTPQSNPAPQQPKAPSTPPPTQTGTCACADCGADVAEKVKTYSERVFKKPLCLNCQRSQPKTS